MHWFSRNGCSTIQFRFLCYQINTQADTIKYVNLRQADSKATVRLIFWDLSKCCLDIFQRHFRVSFGYRTHLENLYWTTGRMVGDGATSQFANYKENIKLELMAFDCSRIRFWMVHKLNYFHANWNEFKPPDWRLPHRCTVWIPYALCYWAPSSTDTQTSVWLNVASWPLVKNTRLVPRWMAFRKRPYQTSSRLPNNAFPLIKNKMLKLIAMIGMRSSICLVDTDHWLRLTVSATAATTAASNESAQQWDGLMPSRPINFVRPRALSLTHSNEESRLESLYQ